MPPPPNDFHVIGDVVVPNPGVDVFLTPKVPQGISGTILILELSLIQQPGAWPQVITWKQARYHKVTPCNPHRVAQILYRQNVIAEITVEEVH